MNATSSPVSEGTRQTLCEQPFVEDLPPSSDGAAVDPGRRRRSIKREPTAVRPSSSPGGYGGGHTSEVHSFPSNLNNNFASRLLKRAST